MLRVLKNVRLRNYSNQCVFPLMNELNHLTLCQALTKKYAVIVWTSGAGYINDLHAQNSCRHNFPCINWCTRICEKDWLTYCELRLMWNIKLKAHSLLIKEHELLHDGVDRCIILEMSQIVLISAKHREKLFNVFNGMY